MNDANAHSPTYRSASRRSASSEASLIGGTWTIRAVTLGIAYALFDLLNREELLSATDGRRTGGPANHPRTGQGGNLRATARLGSRFFGPSTMFFAHDSPAARQRGRFFTSHQSRASTFHGPIAASSTDALTVSYTLSRTGHRLQSPFSLPTDGRRHFQRRFEQESPGRTSARIGAHDTGNERFVFSNGPSSGGVSTGRRRKICFVPPANTAAFWRDVRFSRKANAWAIRNDFSGAQAPIAARMPFYSRFFSSDEIVRGLRPGELGPYAAGAQKWLASGATTYSAVPSRARIFWPGRMPKYRIPLVAGMRKPAGFFDIGSGWATPPLAWAL